MQIIFYVKFYISFVYTLEKDNNSGLIFVDFLSQLDVYIISLWNRKLLYQLDTREDDFLFFSHFLSLDSITIMMPYKQITIKFYSPHF